MGRPDPLGQHEDKGPFTASRPEVFAQDLRSRSSVVLWPIRSPKLLGRLARQLLRDIERQACVRRAL